MEKENIKRYINIKGANQEFSEPSLSAVGGDLTILFHPANQAAQRQRCVLSPSPATPGVQRCCF